MPPWLAAELPASRGVPGFERSGQPGGPAWEDYVTQLAASPRRNPGLSEGLNAARSRLQAQGDASEDPTAKAMAYREALWLCDEPSCSSSASSELTLLESLIATLPLVIPPEIDPAFGPDPAKEDAPGCSGWEVCVVPGEDGKGLGYMATASLSRGERILSESATCAVPIPAEEGKLPRGVHIAGGTPPVEWTPPPLVALALSCLIDCSEQQDKDRGSAAEGTVNPNPNRTVAHC